MIEIITSFLVMLNPFALFIYLQPVMKELKGKDFKIVLLKSSLISFIILFIFTFGGDFIFAKIFQINFESFRIFGGIIIFTMGYLFIVKGGGALINMKEDLNDLASEIALPFMVGSGTISVSVLLGHNFEIGKAVFILIGALAINFAVIMILKFTKDKLPTKSLKIAFDKNMSILLRLNSFFVGAIGLDMIITGINNLYFK